MSDKNFDLEKILDSEKTPGGEGTDKAEISFKREESAPKSGVTDAELDELLSFGGQKTAGAGEVHSEEGTDSASAQSEQVQKLMGGDLEEHFGAGRTGERARREFEHPDRAPVQRAQRSAPKKKRKKRKSYFNGSIFGGIILVVIILTTSMVLAVAGLSLGMEYYGINKSDNEISFNIPEGSSNEDIADILIENGIIKNKKLFLAAIKLQKPEKMVPGDITLKPSMGYSDIISRISVSRESYEAVTITFTEGEYLVDIAAKLEEAGVCTADDFIWEFNKNQGYSFESRLTEVENTFYDREGYFFPDTYEFYVGKEDYAFNVTKIIREHFEEKITQSMYNRMDRQKMDLNEVMTLASIVQLESPNTEEMSKIASVFINRLDDPDTFPMLQSDTTTNYINNVIKPNAGNDESIDHYTEYYDTYSCVGLPAGPICNPGIDAINAVLYPDDTEYYYFCSNLETGETFYAETLDEHEDNLIRAGLVEGELDDDDEDEDEEEE